MRHAAVVGGPPARPATRVSILRGIVAVLVVLGSVLALVPLGPVLPVEGLDGAWAAAINAAVAGRLAFGRDIVFTFGPYAAIYTWIFHPATDAMVLGGTLLLAAALSAGLLRLTREGGGALALLLLLLLPQMWLRDPNLFLLPMLFIAVACRAARAGTGGARWADAAPLALLAIALALLPLVKGTLSVACGFALGLGGLTLVLAGRWRLVVTLGALFATAMAGFWLASGQALPDLPRFFLAQGEIVRGYTPAMSLAGPTWVLVAFGVAVLAVLALNLPRPRADGFPGVALWLGAAGLIALGYKGGFVRADAHVVIAGGTLAVMALVLALGRGGVRPLAGVVVGLLAWGTLDHLAFGFGPAVFAERARASVAGAVSGVAARLRPGALTRAYEERLAAIRRESPLPAIAGRADIYSTGQTALLAHGAAWSPRPVLQSYSAYTPRLAALNAAHLTGPRAPETVLLALEPVDDRLAAHEDGLSWPALLARYEVTGLQGRLAALRRRPDAPRTAGDPHEGMVREVIAAGRHAMGERVPLPAAPHALWATIVLRPTPLGHLAAAALRPPTVRIALELPGGRVLERRFVPGAAEAGFLLAPVVEDVRGLLALAVPGAPIYPDLRPVAFTLSAAPEGLWRGDYALELRGFAAPPDPAAAAALFRRPAPAAPAPEGGRCWLDAMDGAVVDHTRPLALPRRVRLTGFGFLTRPEGREPTAIGIALAAPDGRVVEASAEFTQRPDVGGFFGQQGLSRIGFLALLDLDGLRGPHRIAVTMDGPGGRQSCSLFHDVAAIGGR